MASWLPKVEPFLSIRNEHGRFFGVADVLEGKNSDQTLSGLFAPISTEHLSASLEFVGHSGTKVSASPLLVPTRRLSESESGCAEMYLLPRNGSRLFIIPIVL